MKFEIYQDVRDEYRWRARADNGRIIADSSEGYRDKSDCLNAIEVIRKGAKKATLEDNVKPVD